jgi:hypothetical protein
MEQPRVLSTARGNTDRNQSCGMKNCGPRARPRTRRVERGVEAPRSQNRAWGTRKSKNGSAGNGPTCEADLKAPDTRRKSKSAAFADGAKSAAPGKAKRYEAMARERFFVRVGGLGMTTRESHAHEPSMGHPARKTPARRQRYKNRAGARVRMFEGGEFREILRPAFAGTQNDNTRTP